MEYVYHGSSQSNLKRLEPHKSTHGTFLYATPSREIAIIFAKNCGDDLTYALEYNNQNKQYDLVELMPNAFEVMFGNDASIYTLNGETFKDMNTGFIEVLSPVGVDILKEEYLPNVYDAVKKLNAEGKIKIYEYENRPEKYKDSNKRFIDSLMYYSKMHNIVDQLNKKSFSRLVLFHPEAIDEVNKTMLELNIDDTPYDKNDVLMLYKKMVVNDKDIYLAKKFEKSIKQNILSSFPTVDLEIQDNSLKDITKQK